MAIFRTSTRDKYRERARGLAGMLRGDSPALRVLIFLAMSAIFFLFLKITERKIPRGLAPDSTVQQITLDTATSADTGASPNSK